MTWDGTPNSVFGYIESRNWNPSLPYDYQQGTAFVDQYGPGTAGFNNWLSQAVQNNPSLTWGDAYAQYNAGTGTPGSGPTWAGLGAGQYGANGTAAYNNASSVFASQGINPNSPIGSAADQSFTSAANALGAPGAAGQMEGAIGAAGTPAGDAAAQASGLLGGGSGSMSGFFQAIGNWLQNASFRAIAVIIGIILIAGAVFMMAHGDMRKVL